MDFVPSKPGPGFVALTDVRNINSQPATVYSTHAKQNIISDASSRRFNVSPIDEDASRYFTRVNRQLIHQH